MKKMILPALLIILILVMSSCMRESNDKNTDDKNDPPHTIDDQTGVGRDPVTPSDENPSNPVGDDPVKPDEPDTVEPSYPTVGEPNESGVVAVAAIALDRTELSLHVGQIDMPWETIYPHNATDKSTEWRSSNPSVASVDQYGRITALKEGHATVTVTSKSTANVFTEVSVDVTPSAYPDSPTYVNGIMIANKSYPLPADYNPGVDSTAYSALEEMIQAAQDDGIELFVISGFRSFERQQTLYSNYLLREGRDAADRYSARPGYSEHQTGLAFDLNSLEFSFGETAEGKWLSEHCAEYGFIIRYPADKEEETGYMYEPWHVRYLGVETASDVASSGLCLEEYLGITSEYN